MKAVGVYIAIFAVLLLIIPMIALGYDLETPAGMQPQVHSPSIPAMRKPDDASQSELVVDSPVPEPDETETAAQIDAPYSDLGVETFQILDTGTGEVMEISVRDYVRGAVAAEMPSSFHPEALKAQAVASHTYALHNHYAQLQSPDPELEGADFAADPSNMKGYATEQSVREFYGDTADEAWSIICSAADSVADYVLEYDDEPIVAAYHAISSGQTEDAANVWTGSAPYLLPAVSEGDLLAPGYESSAEFTEDELRAQIEATFPDITLQTDPTQWFGKVTRSESGYVVEIEVGDGTLHGKDIRTMLDLRSHNFEISHDGSVFTFTVYGYGHGVGLSQYGADFYARQGETFDEILAKYYSGAELRRVDSTADATASPTDG